MRHAVSGVAGCDEHVIAIHWIAADERQAVHRFHHFTRPAILDAFDHRKSMTRPALQRAKATAGIVFLSRLMIFTTNNQHVVSLGSLSDSFNANVVVRIRRVPIKTTSNLTTGNTNSDYIGLIR